MLRQYILTDTHHSTVQFKTTPNDMCLQYLYLCKLFGGTPMAIVVSPGISPLRTVQSREEGMPTTIGVLSNTNIIAIIYSLIIICFIIILLFILMIIIK